MHFTAARRDQRMRWLGLTPLLRFGTPRRAPALFRPFMARAAEDEVLDTLIFDIDDTLYPQSCGFSDHRNGPVVAKFMTSELGFESEEEALALRLEMFQKYHSTLKGLSVASDEGLLPKPFELYSLGAYWAAHCDFERYLEPNAALRAQLEELVALGYTLVVFRAGKG